MAGKYRVKQFHDVFSDEFLQFLTQHPSDELTKKHLSLIMEKVEFYEDREGLEFVAFFGNQFIIFKSIV